MSKSPLEAVAKRVGERTTEAFESLGNVTRLAIQLALWEAKKPGPPLSELSDPPVSFSELRECVGMRDSGQLNYHLDKLKAPSSNRLMRDIRLSRPPSGSSAWSSRAR